MRLLINRYDHDDKQTIGQLFLLGENDKIIAKWDSLELPWLNNQRRISCIPLGTYKCKQHRSPKFGRTLWLQDVPNRSEILIHSGNYHTQILGCILIGKDLKDINKDGYLDVTRSRVAMKELMDSLKDIDGIMLEIVNSN
jgi:hypothetical protein